MPEKKTGKKREVRASLSKGEEERESGLKNERKTRLSPYI